MNWIIVPLCMYCGGYAKKAYYRRRKPVKSNKKSRLNSLLSGRELLINKGFIACYYAEQEQSYT